MQAMADYTRKQDNDAGFGSLHGGVERCHLNEHQAGLVFVANNPGRLNPITA